MEIGSTLDILLRVFSACMLGFAVGLEREMTNKYAGLRTNILVCLGACLFTIISIYGFPTVVTDEHANGIRDTARVAAQVVTGIGFIGGGTVLRHGATVFGLTTAATLWMVASIGMACGAGLYTIAIISTIISIIILVSVRVFEKSMLIKSTKNTRRLSVNITCPTESADAIYEMIIDKYPKLFEITKKIQKPDSERTKIVVVIEVVGRSPIESTYKVFNKIDGIESLSVQEFKE
ncbi:MAG: MgtC/SapB family protein [Fusobacterium sp.]|nr:MgtC/SapB family protein [Fusobacterium sp.]